MVLALLGFRHDQETGFLPLKQALDGLTAEQASWRPSADAHSIWQLVNHITYWNEYVLQYMRGKGKTAIGNDETFGEPGNPADDSAWEHAVKRADEVCREMRRAVEAASESDLDRTLDGQDMPLKVLLGDIAIHDAYHIGQIMYVRKLQGWHRE